LLSDKRNVLLLLLFYWHFSPLRTLACWTMSFLFSLSATNSLHHLTLSTWRSLSTFSLHLFLRLPLLLVRSGSWVKIFLGILSSSILPRWPNQLILYPFVHFTYYYYYYYYYYGRFCQCCCCCCYCCCCFIITGMSLSLLLTCHVQWLLYVPTTLTLNITGVHCAHRVYFCDSVDVRRSCDYFPIRY